jgi:hypothetical protein
MQRRQTSRFAHKRTREAPSTISNFQAKDAKLRDLLNNLDSHAKGVKLLDLHRNAKAPSTISGSHATGVKLINLHSDSDSHAMASN